MLPSRPLWTCPRCGRTFASHDQVHSCGPLGSVEERRAAMSPLVREIFDQFVAVVRSLGPVEILAEKTRIAFHARMTFAVVAPRRQALNGHLVLADHVDDPQFHRVTTYSAHNHVHEFRLTAATEIDPAMQLRMAQAYQVGLQRHHRRASDPPQSVV